MLDRVIWFSRLDGQLFYSLGKPEEGEDDEFAGPHTRPRQAQSVAAARQRVAEKLPKVRLVGAGICFPEHMGLD